MSINNDKKYYENRGKALCCSHNSLLVTSFLISAMLVPVEACEVTIELEKELEFGEIVAPVSHGQTGWARVDLDGSYTLSSSSLSLSGDSRVGVGVSLGQLRIRVVDAKPGSSVEVSLSSLSSRFNLIPNTAQSFQLRSGETDGEFRFDFGGELTVENGLVGSVVSGMDVAITCTSQDTATD